LCFVGKESLFRLSFTTGAVKSGDLCTDDRVILSLFVDLEPVQIFFRYRHIGEDGLDRAFGNACIAVDAAIGVDEQSIRKLVKCLDRADGRTVGVFTIKAWLGNYIRHGNMGEPAKLRGLDAGMAKLKTYNPANQLSNHWFKVIECLQTLNKNP